MCLLLSKNAQTGKHPDCCIMLYLRSLVVKWRSLIPVNIIRARKTHCIIDSGSLRSVWK